jgi:hypothetical protein
MMDNVMNYTRFALVFLIFAAIFGLVAWAQNTEKEIEHTAVTLADLGVTTEQKAQIKILWELKRQKQIQAIETLRSLNRLARDTMASDAEIREALLKFRQKRSEQEQNIKASEDKLIKSLPPRAQLHLTILGVLDNGLTLRRSGGPSKREEGTQKVGDAPK